MDTSAIAYLLVVLGRTGLDVCGLIFAVVVWDAGKDEDKIYVRLSTRSENSLCAAFLELFHVSCIISCNP